MRVLGMDDKKVKGMRLPFPIFTILIIVASVIASFSPEIGAVFILDRSALARGEVWRLLTAHLVHFTPLHFAYNMLAFGLAGWIIEKKSYPGFGALCLLMAVFISFLMLIFEPAMAYYGGLSGIACGSIFYCGLMGLREQRAWRRICLTVVLVVPVKVLLEIYNGASILPYWGQGQFVTIPISHVTGLLVALLFYLVITPETVSMADGIEPGQSEIP
jgi:rhomboid family GlyGly-CTERM serine protease